MEITHCAVIFKENKVLALQFSDFYGKKIAGYWGLPGGRQNEDESAEEALIREVREETGMIVTRYIPIYSRKLRRKLDGKELTFMCYLCEAEGDVTISEEHSRYEWVSVKEVEKLKWIFMTLIDAIKTAIEARKML